MPDGYIDPRGDIQSTNEIDVRYWEEAELGVTPAAPVVRSLTKVSYDVGLKRPKLTSNRIKANRRADRSTPGGRRAEGSLQDELSLRDHDLLLAAALCGTWVDGASFTGALTVDADAGTVSRASGSFIADGFVAGLYVSLSGLEEAENEGRFRIVSAAADHLVLDGELADEAASAATVKVIGKILRDGKVKRSFGFEVYRTALKSSAYEVARGVRANTAAVSVTAEGNCTVNYGMLGMDVDLNDAPVTGSPNPAPGGAILAGVNGEAFINGESTGVMTTFDANIANGIVATATVGSPVARNGANGKLAASGSTALLLDDSKMLRAWHKGEIVSFGVRLDDEDSGDFLNILFPKVELDEVNAPVTGEGAATLTASWTAFEDEDADAVVIIQRSNAI